MPIPVSVTANCHAIDAPAAILIGGIGGIVMLMTASLLERFRIDDVVGAIPVHVGAGVWGTLAVALFGNLDSLGTKLTRSTQFGIQLLGVAVCCCWAFGISYVALRLINRWFPLRVSIDDEEKGLNVAEHGESTELFDLLTTTAGLYAVVRLPGLSDAVEAFPALGFAILPPGLKGLFFVALLAVIMSTIDSTTFISGIALGRDLLGRGSLQHGGRGAIRLGMVIALALGIVLALAVPSVVELWFTLGSLLIPGLLAPMLVTFSSRWRLTDDAALAAGAAGVGVSLGWYVWPTLSAAAAGGSGAYLLGLEPMIPGLLISVAMVLGLGKRAAAET
ncbi:MAG: hypothetical protein IID01_11645 [Chloroflexi bacterium]|nr:hypothetical protein [Chloroflexota bacterium]